jgi:ATP-dependent 26S proteasome regulatory subunit
LLDFLGSSARRVQRCIKEAVELPLTNPEPYEDIGIKPPKVGIAGLRGAVFCC